MEAYCSHAWQLWALLCTVGDWRDLRSCTSSRLLELSADKQAVHC